MRRVQQTILEPPHGNSLQACVASVLALPLDDVPNFVVQPDYWRAMLEHANACGLSLLKLPLVDGKLPFASVPGSLCIVRGESPRHAGGGHVIVASVASDGLSLEPVHDPHPDGKFLVGSAAWAAFYVAREPALLPKPSAPLPHHAALAEELRGCGFDVFAPMRVSWYNEYIKTLGLSTDSTKYLEASGECHASGEAAPFALRPLPDFGRDGGNCLAFLIGNSRAMWPKFLKWLKTGHADAANPVDAYADEVIRRAITRFADAEAHALSAAAPSSASAAERAVTRTPPAHDIYWSADMTPSRLVDMNRVSRVCGCCYFSDEMFLSIHPTFGSWVAFRAVVVVDLPATHLHGPPRHLESLMSDQETEAARVAFAEALKASSEVELSVDGMPLHLAQKWAAMRDCVGLGREHKYGARQSAYHYTKDRKLLEEAMAEEAEAE